MDFRPGMVIRAKRAHTRHTPGPLGTPMIDRPFVRLEANDTLIYISQIAGGGHEFEHMRTRKTIHAFSVVNESYFEEVK